MKRLEGRVAVVTGGAHGIGKATCLKLAGEGARVMIADIDTDAAHANVKEINEAGGNAIACRANVSKHDDIRAMIEQAAAEWGRLDILVNNAFTAIEPIAGSAVEVTEEEWDYGMSVLAKAIFLGAKHAVPEMQKQGGGSIVNMASVHGLLMAPKWLVYEAGKSAVIGITRQMACDFGAIGIRVNAICPGHIVTERIRETVWADNPTGLNYFEQQYPLRRTGRPEDIANAVAFLCSDEASFITGHALAVDGGHTIQLQENLGVQLARYLQDEPDTHLPY